MKITERQGRGVTARARARPRDSNPLGSWLLGKPSLSEQIRVFELSHALAESRKRFIRHSLTVGSVQCLRGISMAYDWGSSNRG